MYRKYIKFYENLFINDKHIINKNISLKNTNYYHIFYNDLFIDFKTLNDSIIKRITDSIYNRNFNLLNSNLIGINEINKRPTI
jgi:hypothetical protein